MVFGSCLTVAIYMKSKEMSMQVKAAFIRLKKLLKTVRTIVKTIGMTKSTLWYILKKKEWTVEPNNICRPGRLQMTKTDQIRILSLPKKNLLSTWRL